MDLARPDQSGRGERGRDRAEELCGLNFAAQAEQRTGLQYV